MMRARSLVAVIPLALITPHFAPAGAAPQEVTMVMTVLEAHVEPDRVGDLEREYSAGTRDIPPYIVETFLVRDVAEPQRFRIVTIWQSRTALDDMRATGETPRGVQIFQAAGATPELSIFDVVGHRGH